MVDKHSVKLGLDSGLQIIIKNKNKKTCKIDQLVHFLKSGTLARNKMVAQFKYHYCSLSCLWIFIYFFYCYFNLESRVRSRFYALPQRYLTAVHTMYICIIPIINRYMYLSSCSLYSSSKIFKFQPETVSLTGCDNFCRGSFYGTVSHHYGIFWVKSF